MLYIDDKELHFIPLGGSSEIGMNLNVFEYKRNVLIVDMGISFYRKLGIDVIMAGVDYLKDKKVVGIFITHGHEDHIGAVSLLSSKVNAPIFATSYCVNMLKQKNHERDLIINNNWDYKSTIRLHPYKMNVVTIEPKKLMRVNGFQVEYIEAAHSIPQSHILHITTDKVGVVHTGDWKLDDDPVVGYKTDKKRLIEIGNTNMVHVVTCDSTKALDEGSTPSENEVKTNILRCMKKYKDNRIFISCFSSNIARIKGCVDGARGTNRKIFGMGRSLIQNLDTAYNLGYIPPNSIKMLQNVSRIPNDNSIILCTGSQGEEGSTLHQLAYNEKGLTNENDVIIFSSRVIPGNEVEINKMKSAIMKTGARLLDCKMENLHTSGHPSREDIRKMLSWLKPKTFIPMHGDYYHLSGNAEIAHSLNIPYILTCNGAVVKITTTGSSLIGHVYAPVVGLDGNRLVYMDSKFLEDRKRLGTQGMAVVSANTYNNTITTLSYGAVEDNIANKKLFHDIWERELKEVLMENREDEVRLADCLKQATAMFFDRFFCKTPVVVVSINK